MIPNAVVNGTHPGQDSPYYVNREMQINPGDTDFTHYIQDIPILEWTGWDWPESQWQRNDVLLENIIEGIPGVPANNPWHVIRITPQPMPIPMKILNIARVDVLQTEVLWLQRITFQTADPDAPGDYSTYASGYDQYRSDEAVDSDESYGAGYNVTNHNGYFPAKSINIGILERRNSVDIDRAGILTYEEAEIVYEEPIKLANEDVLVLPDGRRGTVSRQITRLQLNGVTIGVVSNLSIHNLDSSVIYRIPIIGG